MFYEKHFLFLVPCGVYPRDPDVLSTDQLMHHKFAVIDDEAVLVGSMNWTTEVIIYFWLFSIFMRSKRTVSYKNINFND